MKLLNTTLIKCTAVFVVGILTGYFIELPLNLIFISLTLAILLFVFAFFRAKKLFLPDVFFGLTAFITIFILGVGVTKIHLPQNQPFHYVNIIPSEERGKESPTALISIEEELKETKYNRRFIAEVKQINGKAADGDILVLFGKDETGLDIDDRLLIASEWQLINSPGNPFGFDYREFMEKRGIFYQLKLSKNEYFLLESTETSIAGLAASFRKKIIRALKENNFSKEELGIVQALLLGQRQDISEEIYEDYAAAGVLHILAVSGLHVGLILLILNIFLSPLERIKHGKSFKTVLLVIFLWLFAVIAGLSPSVVRAVSMFSFLAIGWQYRRRTNAINTLFMSMLAILLVWPHFIFEVGFQLSYLAVFSIVIFQPVFSKIYHPKTRIGKYLWGLTTVTFAAQLGVLPLSLFYFHQFPGLFYLSNLVILPFLGIILGFGIIIMALGLLNILPEILVDLYEFMIGSLNSFVGWVARQEEFLFREIPFSGFQAFGFYLFLISLLFIFKSRRFKNVIFMLISIVLLQGIFIHEQVETSDDEFIIFHKSRRTVLAEKEKNLLQLHISKPDSITKEIFILNYIRGERIDRVKTEKLQNIYPFPKGYLLVIDSTGIYQNLSFRPSYILLTSSPEINLERLIKQLQPKLIIADGSNYRSLVKQWEITSEEKEIPFHYTGEKGAFILKK